MAALKLSVRERHGRELPAAVQNVLPTLLAEIGRGPCGLLIKGV